MPLYLDYVSFFTIFCTFSHFLYFGCNLQCNFGLFRLQSNPTHDTIKYFYKACVPFICTIIFGLSELDLDKKICDKVAEYNLFFYSDIRFLNTVN